jgi:hypothetical protein
LGSRKIEKPLFAKYGINPDQDETNSQQAVSESQRNTVLESSGVGNKMLIK